MNQDIAIRVENLSKVYKLYDKPIDRLKEALNPFKKTYHKEFYALNHVSFEIKRGECVGILGKNGAGKSTILKIITGVLTPTSGKVTVNGRISALLELGAGFNPEYTGMENIYFQGNLMGFGQEEMEAKVQDILSFADIGAFVDQPVKSYSSGMFARLAFAVAISVEPDILIVDEALSVGDAAFQNKCMRKMIHIMEQGATVLFVSHDTQAINKFCTKAIWLKDGIKHMDGKTEDVTIAYMYFSEYGLENTSLANKKNISNTEKYNCTELDKSLINVTGDRFGTGKALISSVTFFDDSNNPITTLKQMEFVKFIIKVVVKDNISELGVGINFYDRLLNHVFTINSFMYNSLFQKLSANSDILIEVRFRVPKVNPGEYSLSVNLPQGSQISHIQHDWLHSAIQIKIISNDFIDVGCLYTIPKEDVTIKLL